jgi:hypothetical protein
MNRPAPDPLLRLAGGLGVGGVVTAILVTLAACGGIDGALVFGLAPVLLGAADIAVVAVSLTRSRTEPDSLVLAAFFTAALALTGGLLQIAVWRHWPILYGQTP